MNWLRAILIMVFTHAAAAGNLNHTQFAEDYPMDDITQLITSANQDAYQLSIPLLISAALGNQVIYDEANKQMNAAMQVLTQDTGKNSFAAWLYGRMAMAADNIHDQKSDAIIKLKALLQNPDTKPDYFKAWAFAYLASLNHQEYADAKPAMLNLAKTLTAQYKPENISDMLWVWVMVTQAAAHAHDLKTYHHALQQMMQITQTKSTRDALEKIPESDFNKWATAIVATAAQKMNQPENLPALTGDPTTPDHMLAQVTYELAKQEKIYSQKQNFNLWLNPELTYID